MLKSHIDLCLHRCVHNLQTEITRRRQSSSPSAYADFEEMVMAMVRIEEHAQTMRRQVAAVGWIVR